LPVRRLFILLSLLAICNLFASAAVSGDGPDPDPTWDLPVLQRLTIPQPNLAPVAIPNCSVEPLSEILDADAIRQENNEDGPDTAGLLPEMSQALEKFRQLVARAGGSFDLKSAFRPLEYQEHLREVWLKWMRELRFNRQPGCQELRAQVGEEFTRHKLMPTQMPVTDSDHTRGMAFDAAVMMPRSVRIINKKRRVVGVSLDHLASLAGLKRPDIRRDPVHFKLVVSLLVHTLPSE
jgi:hypothetical protein